MYVTVLTVYWPTLRSMAAVWARSDTYSHGVLVLPIALWLIVRARHAIAAATPRPCWWGLAPLVASVLTWLVAWFLQADVVTHAAMIAMVPAVVLLVFGSQVLRATAFPLVIAFLAVPAGEFLVPPMMDLTAHSTVAMLMASGVPVFQDRWLISIPAGDFLIANACSGVRYLIGTVTAGALFAGLFFRGWPKRLVFLGFAAVFTVAANILRAYVTVVAGHLTDMRLAAAVDHVIYGWVLFATLIAIVFGVGLRFADDPRPGAAGDASACFRTTVATAMPRFAVPALAALAVLIGGAALPGFLPEAAGVALAAPVHAGGARLAGAVAAPPWLREDPGWEALHLHYQGPVSFDLHVFRGRRDAGGRDLIALREEVDPQQVVLVAEDTIEAGSRQQPLRARRMRLDDGRQETVVVYWFLVGGDPIANPVTAKLVEGWTMLTGGHKRPALVALALDSNQLEQPGASLNTLVDEVSASMQHCLQVTGLAGSDCRAPGIGPVPPTSVSGVEGSMHR